MFKILLVDQTTKLLTASEDFWRGSGYAVQFTQARTMQASIECAIKNVYWYIDINADSMDYLPQLPVLRRSSNAPIVALATEKNRQKEIAAYDAGVDVYTTWAIVREQTPKSIIAFMGSFSRRPTVAASSPPGTITQNDIVLSLDYHSCTVRGKEIPMTKTEFDILYCLMLHKGQVLSPRQIYCHVWGEDAYDETPSNTFRAHMKRLKRKMSESAPDVNYIENVRGIGYRFIA